MRDEWEITRVLITVKTYPIPSTRYDELVCTAGVREDGSFVRLYPINFRDLDYARQYQEYQWIQLEATRHKGRDVRKESYRPRTETIRLLGERIPTRKGDWSERGKYVLRQKSKSMEDLKDQQSTDKTSLGIFKPKAILDLEISPDEPDWKPQFKAHMAQARLWEDRTVSRRPPRKVPFKFHYGFECDDKRCTSKHRMMIEDWEVGTLFWKCVDDGATHTEACRKVKDKFLGDLCGPDKDTHFYVGTILAHPKSWVVIGVWWPQLPPPPSPQRKLPF